MELATLDCWYLLREWKRMEGARIQKIYGKDRALILQLHSAELGARSFLVRDGEAFFTTAKMQYPEKPSGYVMFLRKRIQGLRIKSIDMLGFDRVLTITVETKEGPLVLIAELFGKINTMLCKDGKIISAFETHSYTDRTIRGGITYTPPPGKPAPWDADFTALAGKQAGKAIATELGLGGKYSDELCARANLDKKHVLATSDLEQVRNALSALRDHPTHAVENGSEALPFPFRTKQGDWRAAPSFNDALDTLTRESLETTEEREQETVVKAKLTKQEKILSAQRAKILEIEQIASENQRIGELIYENYTELSVLLETIKADWKTHSYAAIVEKYSEHPRIKKINEDGTIEVLL